MFPISVTAVAMAVDTVGSTAGLEEYNPRFITAWPASIACAPVVCTVLLMSCQNAARFLSSTSARHASVVACPATAGELVDEMVTTGSDELVVDRLPAASGWSELEQPASRASADSRHAVTVRMM